MYVQTVRMNKYIKQIPTEKQALFLLHNEFPEVFFGGSAGPGKSSALLMAALQYVHVPGYAAIIFRKTYRDLALPGALMDRAKEWLAGADARWKEEDKTWVFPSGATLTFGYLDGPMDKYRYQGSEVSFIGFDELTQIREEDYLYLFSRVRRPKNSKIPLRIRAASNPPNKKGGAWVKQRFLIENAPDRIFIPALMTDNPHLDQEAYRQSLMHLDPVTRQQLLNGDWDVQAEGNLFKREWFEIVENYPRDAKTHLVRYWDMAATEDDGDYTAGCLMAEKDGVFYIADMEQFQLSSQGVEARMLQTAQLDSPEVPVRWEEEGGSSGKFVSDYLTRKLFFGYKAMGIRSTGSKVTRASPFASAAEAGNVKVVRGSWNGRFLDEVMMFPLGDHDDQVDAASGAFAYLVSKKRNTFIPVSPSVKANRERVLEI